MIQTSSNSVRKNGFASSQLACLAAHGWMGSHGLMGSQLRGPPPLLVVCPPAFQLGFGHEESMAVWSEEIV